MGRSTDPRPPSRTLAHLLVVGLVAFAAFSGFATTQASGAGANGGGLALGFVDLVRGADGDQMSASATQYELVPDPEKPQILVDRGYRPAVPDPTPLPTPVAPPRVKKPVYAAPQHVVGNGQLVWPVPGAIITQYYSSTHPALDLAAPTGTRVLAGDAGTIIWSGWKSTGGGLQIWIDHHNGFVTRYLHLSVALWVTGDVVARGQQVGQVGCTGSCTGPHTHFEVLINGVHVNPLRYL